VHKPALKKRASINTVLKKGKMFVLKEKLGKICARIYVFGRVGSENDAEF
jgi:hypothetical protein